MSTDSGPTAIELPLCDRHGVVLATALVDQSDAALSAYAWQLSEQGYARRPLWEHGRKRWVRLHREVLGLERGNPLLGDHINGDRLDCRRSNLRVVTAGQNAQNRASYANTSSRFRGVSRRGDRFDASIKLGGRSKHLGRFRSELVAAWVAATARDTSMPYSNGGERGC